ncbi:MAG: NADH-quinone oxidoreductase subunit N [Ilumatobacteraceae bacterium]|nr:NADH-quinone oxidoreductase subunit N [Ilumatobacteraceae bacterium]
MLAQEFAQEFIGPEVQWFALTPMLVLLGGGLGMMVLGALTPRWPRGLYALMTSLTAGTAAVLAMVLWDDITDRGTDTLVGGALAFDTFAQFVTIIVCVAVILVSMITDGELGRIGQDGPEVYALYLMAAIGAVVMGASNDFIVLFLGLETLSLALYVLAALDRRRSQSQEAGIKYLVLGGFASAFFLYGIALLYGGTGSTNISEVITSFQTNVSAPREDAMVLAGIALLIVGLAFKVAAVPFHEWAPDVYQGAPSQTTAFMAAVGKAAAFAAMLRVLVIALPFHRDDWRPVIWVLAALSLVIGSALAAVQSNVKRMLAYSSISHAGFILVGVEAAGHRAGETEMGSGMPSVLVYLLLYSVLVIGSFAVVTVIARNHDGDTDLSSFAGLAARRPALALALTVFLLAQAGVPFTTGFIAKFGVIQAAVDEQSYAIAIIAMLAAVIAAFMYLRIMVSVWLQSPETDEPAERVPFGTGLAIGAAAIFTIVVGIVPGWLIDAADTVTQYAR